MTYLEELLPEFRKGAKIRFSSWGKGQYICVKDGEVFDEQGRKIFNIGSTLILLGKWELYQEPKLDWRYVIKNKCLCWFWDDDESEKESGLLREIIPNRKYKYNGLFLNCRPVSKDELTFYEDKKR